ncbi:hypothetical protein AMS68_002913 [Peltaster fructicola]|uniref:GDP-Man:Man(3)GlcNAc(2)-PP-Dol alpha-1,2-mannosyltransferase n=1 Tax=Peltaster fructicola TaxID=286661 RepID=A0A6H0XRS8_9PEZI|nr:hypothetical protein AMS68_002913 [Peltaster fructicola]
MLAATLTIVSICLIAASSPYILRLVGHSIGAQIRSRTQKRRELFFARAANEAKSQPSNDIKSTDKSSSSASVDDDWEKVNATGSEASLTEQSEKTTPSDYAGIIGFFHPFCNAGGGGERVLFAAVLATQQKYPKALCVVYTGDNDATKESIISNVHTRFNIKLNAARVAFVYLTTREWVLASTWPHFTLLGQSLGSLILAWDALSLMPPDVFIDTMGYAFALALSKWLFPKMPTCAYVHYPTISTDMLSSLHDESGTHGVNAGTGQGLKGKAKQMYWNVFAKAYSWVGGSIDIVMTNSTWTQNHISALWSRARQQRSKQYPIITVYPPCAVQELQDDIPLDETSQKHRTQNLLYIAQFRPEKMHHIIIDAFHAFLKDHKPLAESEPKPKLILLGSVRDDSDEKRVYKLRLQAQAIRDSVEFIVNAKWPQILELLKSSSIGVNGMWNEHFGIGVVEYQAAGLISIVNRSGGPKEDIVVNVDDGPTSFHASTIEEYTEAFAQALSLSREQQYSMRQRARKSALRFSEAVFCKAWTTQMERLVALADPKAASL